MRNGRLSIPGVVLALKRDKDHNLFLFANARNILCSQVTNEESGAYSKPGVNQFSASILLPFDLKFPKKPNQDTKGCTSDVLRWLRICGVLKYRFSFTARRIWGR